MSSWDLTLQSDEKQPASQRNVRMWQRSTTFLCVVKSEKQMPPFSTAAAPGPAPSLEPVVLVSTDKEPALGLEKWFQSGHRLRAGPERTNRLRQLLGRDDCDKKCTQNAKRGCEEAVVAPQRDILFPSPAFLSRDTKQAGTTGMYSSVSHSVEKKKLLCFSELT